MNYTFYSQRKIDKEICRKSVDISNGILLPYYDHDTKVVFLAGKVSKTRSILLKNKTSITHVLSR